MTATLHHVLDPGRYAWTLAALPPFTVAAAIFAAVVLACVRSGWTRLTAAGLQIGTLMAVWLAGTAMAYTALDVRVAFCWARVAWIGVALIPAAALNAAALNVAHPERYRRLVLASWLVSLAFVALDLGTELLISGMRAYWWGRYSHFGVLGMAFVAYSVAADVLEALIYVRAYRATEPGSPQARRLRGILASVLIGCLASLDYLPNAGVPLYPFGWLTVLLSIAVLSRTILRYDLPDITPASTAEQIIATMRDALLVVDHEQIIRLVNPAACGVFGRPAPKLLGLPVARLASELHAVVRTVEVGSGALEHELVLPAGPAGAPRIFGLKMSTMRRRETIVATVCLLRDVTALKAIQRDLERARDAAEAATRAKSEFLANVSHEVRTPINIVFGMTEMLLDGPLTAEQRDYVTTVQRSAESLLAIINDILDLSKVEARKLTLESVPFSPRAVIADVVHRLTPRATAKRLALRSAVDSAVPETMLGDPTRVQQVVVNLLGNAIKFTDHGHVDVRVTVDDGGHVHVAVADTGIGIPAEKQAEIFEAFAQADVSTTRRFGGTGLGLAICRQLVTMMHGTLWVDSTPGRGSTFHVTLPVAGPREQATADAA